jgi:hypothetical protein
MSEETSTTTDAGVPAWRQELSDHVTVALDGTLPDPDPDLPDGQDRVMSRVVISMPDYLAHSLSHLIARFCRLTDVFGEPEWLAPTAPELAEALAAAASAAGCYCPERERRCSAARTE